MPRDDENDARIAREKAEQEAKEQREKAEQQPELPFPNSEYVDER